MSEVSLHVPTGITESLPKDGETAAHDMDRTVSEWERRVNALVSEDPSGIVDVVDRFEDRWEQYDAYVVELRAWGQSPIYAMAWRDLYESMIQQLYSNEDMADVIDRERNARLVEGGIRLED